MAKKKKPDAHLKELFSDVKTSFMDYDPVYFTKNNLTLDGAPFSVLDNGWKFMADIYRYIALESVRENGKPVVICKGRQIGATVMAAALDLYFTNSGLFANPPAKVAHLFPTIGLVKRFSQSKLEDLIRAAKDDFINKNKLNLIEKNAVDNITMKQFINGTLWIESIGIDGDRVRGMSLDVAIFDECQDMLARAINNVTKTLTPAKYGPKGKGVQVYFGTPKERGSFFHRIWEMSDKRYYQFGCLNCNDYFFFYHSDIQNAWKDIWIGGHIIKCPLCGHKQTKIEGIQNGRWIPTKNPDEAKYVGFHVNQLYIPYFQKSTILELMPENNPTQTERVWNNEVIGEFYSGAGTPLTKQDIADYAMDYERSFSTSLNPERTDSYLGVDWGGKVDNDSINRGMSFSCVVILSATRDGTLLVEHGHKLRSQAFKYKKDTIIECYRRFGIKRGVSDWYFGQDVVHELQLIYGHRFFGAQGSGALRNPLKFREDEKMISYNKDLLIEEVFDKIKKGKIRFPGKPYEKVEWLVEHCTSMDGATRLVSGQQLKTFKKGAGPNDGLMALLYAYIAWKFDATKGFSFKLGEQREERSLRPILAYAPFLKV